ncbi:Glucose/arabinose dehydrogenase, beta-propeller fold [Streptoalloteichus tenebrarius]|uniref:Glucose/arabinose dehydrogenase, beta-propeller fold n=1 Tax=Streptoalloteichus tenebrarius (strain ATCC 17920 / DSM 40477 / JCM 4838 / CBS 697.72 / NBRC 16177 / NCIMB 11028 / NRRL B-12390 / A12253. 1 / ISP 5477) TaxID=1933 RepID=A0ABT1HWR3_STRSD|nr:Glucose/arabinose dehydrogenase, beta-propeller fold [Streptoalloteichus tenebrarius]BFF03267.1 PQQ-dependent sugar dehydrogenase [Streptoalloteichus tenebrarius]
MFTRPAVRVALAAGVSALALVTSCARFPDARPAENWQEKPHLTPEAGPKPRVEGDPENGPRNGQGGRTSSSVPPPQGCRDFDPAVIGTCLEPVTAVATLGEATALAADRTGRVVRVEKGRDPVEIARIPVDTAGDGGLTGLALSPNYAEDELIYAYVTTATDNRVVRFARNDTPKPVLTGIPKGGSGNRGALASDRKGNLLVATGDAGNAAAANDPNSLAGKVLRIDTAGKPAKDNPNAGSPVLASGLHAPGGLCTDREGKASWVTDRAQDRDLLFQVRPGKLDTPAWNWPDRPGVGGCAVGSSIIAVALERGAALANLLLNPDGTFKGQPQLSAQNQYGRLSAADVGPDGTYAFFGTMNKAGGQPVSSDDRVVAIPLNKAGSANGKD